jgi:carbon-monoxide dehydrogenase large subunit
MTLQDTNATSVRAPHIGQAHRRETARRHLAGRGRFVSDIALPRMLHAAFVRSPMARGRIVEIDTSDAEQSPGVVRVFTARDLNPLCKPWTGTLDHFASMVSAPQNILADGRFCGQGTRSRWFWHAPARKPRTPANW